MYIHENTVFGNSRCAKWILGQSKSEKGNYPRKLKTQMYDWFSLIFKPGLTPPLRCPAAPCRGCSRCWSPWSRALDPPCQRSTPATFSVIIWCLKEAPSVGSCQELCARISDSMKLMKHFVAKSVNSIFALAFYGSAIKRWDAWYLFFWEQP